MFERAGLGVEDFACRTIFGAQNRRWGVSVGAFAFVVDPAVAIFAAHSRVEVGEMKPGARDRDGDEICGVETEEPDAGLVAMRYIRADVEFGECGETGQHRS